MITDKEHIKVGHWITFSTDMLGVNNRRFLLITKIRPDGSYVCMSLEYINTVYLNNEMMSVIIKDLFENPDHNDEVYETLDEIKSIYPEDFI